MYQVLGFVLQNTQTTVEEYIVLAALLVDIQLLKQVATAEMAEMADPVAKVELVV